MELTPARRKQLQDHFGYSDAEMDSFLGNPRNLEVLAKAPAMMNTTIVATVVESHGCNSRHHVGDKFYFDGAGNLLTEFGPSRICIYALNALTGLIFSANELFYAGIDPNRLRFNRTGCFDVGVGCGGWGRIVMELTVQSGKMVKPEK